MSAQEVIRNELNNIITNDPSFYYCVNLQPPPLNSLVIWLNNDNKDISGYKGLASSADMNKNLLIKVTDNYSQIKPFYGNIDKWYDLRKRQNDIGSYIQKVSREVNPAENIGNYSGLKWIGRAGLKLANIDAIFNLSNSNSTFRDPIDVRPFNFVDLAGGPGAFTQYLQYRRPRSEGWGMSLETEKKGCAWELSQLDTSRFNILKGADGSGDIIKNYYWTIQEIHAKAGNRIDLVVSDGFIKEDATVTFEDYINEEVINLSLLICELGIGINILKEGRDLICKVSDTLRPITAEVLFVLTLAFEKVCLFKPMTSRAANAEKYVICQTRRKDVSDAIRIFSLYYEQISNGYIASPVLIDLKELGNPNSLYKLPQEFEEKLIKSNNFYIDSQMQQLVKIEDRINGKTVVIRNLNLPRVYNLWHIPMRGDRYVPSLGGLKACK
jgi:cap1 methyltransferase